MEEEKKVKHIILSEEQQEALDILVNWFKNNITEDIKLSNAKYDKSIPNVFTLAGSAGTGKSTLMLSFLNTFKFSKIGVTAPTHKAKKVIYNITKRESCTIQKLLGLKPNLSLDDFDPNNPIFEQLFTSTIGDYELIIIDECSMIPADLYNLLVKEADNYDTKLLFIGDPLQLPPVKEHISKTFKNINYYKLNKVHRQSLENPLLKLLNIIRNDLICSTVDFDNIIESKRTEVSGQNGFVIVDNYTIFMDHLIEYHRKTDNPDYVKYTAWTNADIQRHNKIIRNQLHPDSSNKKILPDEILLSYNSVANESMGVIDIILINSEEYRVKYITEGETSDGIEYYLCDLSAVDYDHNIRTRIVKESSYETFDYILARYLKEAKQNRAWKKYYNFKNMYLILGDFRGKFSGYIKKDLDYNYGITVHKTQGSTYDYIFVNGRDINKCKNNIDRLKLWYVALSRARYKAFIYV